MKMTLAVGSIGTAATFAFVNTILGTVAGVITIAILLIKLRRMWNHRDEPPTDT